MPNFEKNWIAIAPLFLLIINNIMNKMIISNEVRKQNHHLAKTSPHALARFWSVAFSLSRLCRIVQTSLSRAHHSLHYLPGDARGRLARPLVFAVSNLCWSRDHRTPWRVLCMECSRFSWGRRHKNGHSQGPCSIPSRPGQCLKVTDHY